MPAEAAEAIMVSPRDAIHDAIGVLNDLIQTCRDGEEGFRTAAGGVDDANLKRLFASYAQQRAEFIHELQREVRQLGGDPEERGHAAGAVHRGWINIKAAVTGKDEGAVISECERGEDVAKRNYQHALEQTLPSDVRLVIERQYMQVKDAHDHVRSLEKAHSNR
jgi:uncharacterized protein (TIGR02284 family)